MRRLQINVATLAGLMAPFGGLCAAIATAGSEHAPVWATLIYAACGFVAGLLLFAPVLSMGQRILLMQFRPEVGRLTKVLAFAIYMAWPLVAIVAAASASVPLVVCCCSIFHGWRTAG